MLNSAKDREAKHDAAVAKASEMYERKTVQAVEGWEKKVGEEQ
jgi:hypothetical protein